MKPVAGILLLVLGFLFAWILLTNKSHNKNIPRVLGLQKCLQIDDKLLLLKYLLHLSREMEHHMHAPNNGVVYRICSGSFIVSDIDVAKLILAGNSSKSVLEAEKLSVAYFRSLSLLM
jgi:hypothetical protein